jgi:uroporphyrinogen decarboxylase
MSAVSELPCGERCVRCLLGEPVDRVPFGVGFGWTPWEQTKSLWREAAGDSRLTPADYFGYDKSFAYPDIRLGVYPFFERDVLSEDDEHIVYRDERGITMRQRRDYASMPEFLDYPVKGRDDWERLKAERLRIDQPGRVAEDWLAFRDRLDRTGEAVQVGGFPYGVFGTMRDLLGVESLLVAFYDHPDMVLEMVEHLTSLWLAVWQRVAEHVQIDHIHIWEDMSGRQGSLISPAMVRHFMMPCYDRIADFARRAGVRLVSVDTDGDCRELVPVFMEHGVNVVLPFEVQAGNDVRLYRRDYPTLGIWGGLDKRALAAGKAEIDVEVAKAKEMICGGRYLPSFDHLIPPDVPWGNFRYAVERLRELCCDRGYPNM